MKLLRYLLTLTSIILFAIIGTECFWNGKPQSILYWIFVSLHMLCKCIDFVVSAYKEDMANCDKILDKLEEKDKND